MSTGICKSPASRYWRALYKAAVSGIDMSKLPERIAEAEKAVVLRNHARTSLQLRLDGVVPFGQSFMALHSK